MAKYIMTRKYFQLNDITRKTMCTNNKSLIILCESIGRYYLKKKFF